MIVLLIAGGILALDMRVCLERAGHRVLGPAGTADLAATLAKAHRPDLALVDIGRQDGNAQALVRDLRERFGTPSLLTGTSREAASAYAGLAFGFLDQPFQEALLLQAIEAAAAWADSRPMTPPDELLLLAGV